MIYDWEFGELDCYKSSEGQTDVVFDVAWRLTAKDGDSSWSDGGHLEVNYQSGNYGLVCKNSKLYHKSSFI